MTEPRLTIITPQRTIHCAYALGDIVYYRLARERLPGLVTGIKLTPQGLSYLVSWPDHQEHQHYEMELSTEFVPDYGAE
jgi:hypothetical protein